MWKPRSRCLRVLLFGAALPLLFLSCRARISSETQTFPSIGHAGLHQFLAIVGEFVGPSQIDHPKTIAFMQSDENCITADLDRDGTAEKLVMLNGYVPLGWNKPDYIEGTSGMRSWAIVAQSESGGWRVVQAFPHSARPRVQTSTTNGWYDIVVVHKGGRDEHGIRRGSAGKLAFDGKKYVSVFAKDIRTDDGFFQEDYPQFLKEAGLR